ncbi:MAG: hypothetical protein IPP01_11375 [Saprospiraceae bacterium]|nr:hypothetical protein [Saprospiraceae bacterium]
MKSIFYYSILIIILGFGCKQDKNTNSNSTNQTSTAKPTTSIPKDNRPRTAYGKVDESFSKLSSSAKPYLMITDSIWLFAVAINPSEKNDKPIFFEKTWLDLKESGDYEYGKAETLIDKGKFTYNATSTELEMRSMLKDSASLWRVKVDPDAMILIGEEKYANNPWQIKLVRKSNFNQPLN